MGSRYRMIDALCIGCGICMEICPYGDVELLRDERKGTPFAEILCRHALSNGFHSCP